MQLEYHLSKAEQELAHRVMHAYGGHLHFEGVPRVSRPLPFQSQHRFAVYFENGGIAYDYENGSTTDYFPIARKVVSERMRGQPNVSEMLQQLGDVFWFDQNRNIATVSKGANEDNGNGSSREHESWNSGVQRLREALILAWSAHKSEIKGTGRDIIPDLTDAVSRVFAGLEFAGSQLCRADPEAGSVTITFSRRGEKLFDISEIPNRTNSSSNLF